LNGIIFSLNPDILYLVSVQELTRSFANSDISLITAFWDLEENKFTRWGRVMSWMDKKNPLKTGRVRVLRFVFGIFVFEHFLARI